MDWLFYGWMWIAFTGGFGCGVMIYAWLSKDSPADEPSEDDWNGWTDA